MASIRDAMRYQADFQLLSAAASAAHAMHTSLATGEPDAKRMKIMNDLMKLSHVRQRFAPEEPPRPKRDTLLFDMVCTAHKDATIDALRTLFQTYTGRDIQAEYWARTEAEMKLPESERSIPPAARPLSGLRRHRDEDPDDAVDAIQEQTQSATYVRTSRGHDNDPEL